MIVDSVKDFIFSIFIFLTLIDLFNSSHNLKMICCSPCFVPARSQRSVDSSVSPHHVIAQDVRPVDRHHQLGPAVGTGGLEGDVEREVPHQPGGGVQALVGDLRDALLLTCRDGPVLTRHPEQAAVERVVVREVSLLHLARDGEEEEAAAPGQHCIVLSSLVFSPLPAGLQPPSQGKESSTLHL